MVWIIEFVVGNFGRAVETCGKFGQTIGCKLGSKYGIGCGISEKKSEVSVVKFGVNIDLGG